MLYNSIPNRFNFIQMWFHRYNITCKYLQIINFFFLLDRCSNIVNIMQVYYFAWIHFSRTFFSLCSGCLFYLQLCQGFNLVYITIMGSSSASIPFDIIAISSLTFDSLLFSVVTCAILFLLNFIVIILTSFSKNE